MIAVQIQQTSGAPPSHLRLIPGNRQDPRQGMKRISFEVADIHAPALRSAIEEISNEVGGRLTGQHAFAKEQALTDAAIGLGTLRKAINKVVGAGDPNYV
jgi:hypothetical protein